MVIRKDVIAVAAVCFVLVGLVSTAFIVGSAKEAETMENNDKVQAGAVPTIDLEAPAETETALFALG